MFDDAHLHLGQVVVTKCVHGIVSCQTNIRIHTCNYIEQMTIFSLCAFRSQLHFQSVKKKTYSVSEIISCYFILWILIVDFKEGVWITA